MIVVGIVLLVLGYILPVPVLGTLGILLVVLGIILFLFSAAGYPFAGRRYWF